MTAPAAVPAPAPAYAPTPASAAAPAAVPVPPDGPAVPHGYGVSATARIRAVPDGRGGTALPLLAGDGPLALRRTRGPGPGAQATLVGAMSAPLGGDRLAVEAEVAAGAALTVTSAAATIALPGRDGAPARYDVRLAVEEAAELRWLPEPLICARGSRLYTRTVAELAPSARLLLREEQVLGRAAEEPGLLTSRLRVTRAGRPLLDQELSCGPGAAAGWDGPAVLGGHRAIGQLLVVDPRFEADPVTPRMLGEYAAVTPLAGPAVLVTVLAPDGLRLRALLDGARRAYGW
ncbi:urease accessory protein UreD [Streptomyces sp. NRRL S-87]|uniref:urease accessory protein UreD n=1 Tax=Streptomyces sp. NRRL S-87 TaxID=1463920 RepID=UPI00099CAD1E|nr:urease accessory protein UreD [Streptomyces sp. NRRL S-87]